MKIVVFGMGYVGIPTAALFADVQGIYVIGVQRSSKRSGWKIEHINEGKSPIGGNEPGLSELIKKVVKKGKLRVTDDISVCRDADVIVVSVQTPVDENHLPIYKSLTDCLVDIGKNMSEGVMVILESTVAPGTTENIVKPILEKQSNFKAGEEFNLVFSPERVMAGRLIHNMVNLPRIIGGYTGDCTNRAVELYKKIVKSKIFTTDCLTAEIAKLTENTYRDVNIAFANEIALICESLGVNVHEVRELVNALPFDSSEPSKNPYRNLHIPGAGVGGHCLPKDPWLLKYGLEKFGSFKTSTNIIVESRRTNDNMPFHMKELIVDALREQGKKLEDSRICILGFAFLENSDDTRNTPALTLFDLLKDKCKEVIVHDPYVKEYEDIKIEKKIDEALYKTNCIAVVTRHKQYLDLKLSWLKKLLETPVIVDGRNIFNPNKCREAGFIYRGIGVGSTMHRRA
jgi:UDP-N-acetyl-D-mannosaminuronic acid dehydrogenase